ncbi:MAG: response regulator [Nitrospirales bacterium]|nr:response regulator [Nitrospira sp.]MDR4500164.1 response regulator [Nitrospirales bacterium]
MLTQAIKILLVENDQEEVYSLQEALTVSQIVSVDVQEVEDGEQALAYLRQEHPFLDVPRPNLILLDVKLPGVSGLEVLEEIHQEHHLRQIPIAILYHDSKPRISTKIQKPPMPRYVFKKPTNCNEWIYILRCIEDVWLTITGIPSQRVL